LRPTDDGHLVATEAADRPTTHGGEWARRLRNGLFGQPLSSERESGERLNKVRALAIFASDALSSSAYATEEILLVLVTAGAIALGLGLPISIGIAILLAMVTMSYMQTVRAYPNGGGAYSVSRENIGPWAGLIAAAALLTDYVLTVAVSISAGSLAIISAIPALADYRVQIAMVALVLLTLGNLRGVRESGTVFAVPTYLFILSFSAMIVFGAARLAIGHDGATLTSSAPPQHTMEVTAGVGLLLVLRAFASGSTALTGVEAIANGVTAFQEPAPKNARITMAIMGGILAFFFVGATFLAWRLGVVPVHDESVISQIGRSVFGTGSLAYYFLQATTATVLILAANTAYNGFPRLASILAEDRYMPRQFAYIGDRLTFVTGIVALTLVSAAVIVLFQADTHRLIPLYAIGVFAAFTLSQIGMFRHWRSSGERGWWRPATINGIGAVMTGVVMVVVAGTKFTHGAWFVLILVPVMVWLLGSIHAHYTEVARITRMPDEDARPFPRPTGIGAEPVVVTVRDLNRVSWRAVQYGRRLSSNVTGVHIAREGHEDLDAFQRRWARLVPDVPLVVVESPYRTFVGPLLAYVDRVALDPRDPVLVLVPEFRPRHWWARILHNRTTEQIQVAAEQRPNLLVVQVTVHQDTLRELA
jgi:amino acid transporter